MSARDSRSPFSPRFRPSESLSLFIAAPVLIILSGPALAPLGLAGMVVAQLAFIAGPAVWVARRRRSALALLGLRPVPAAALAGALLIGASFWYVNVWLVVPISSHVPGGGQELSHLDALFFSGGSPLPVKLLAIAVVPAVCEEILARGALARSLRPAVGVVPAVVVSAILFGLLHLSLVRLLPTAALGLVLGAAALATDSAIPGVVIHLENNAVAVLLGAGAAPGAVAALSAHPAAAGTAAISGLCAGAALIGWAGFRRLRRTQAAGRASSQAQRQSRCGSSS